MRNARVLVVGGGIAGMVTALCLRRAGVAAELVERDADWRALGAGLTINGATMRALDRIGLLKDLLPLCAYGDSRQLRTGDDKLIFEQTTTGRYGPGIPMIGGVLRPEFHRYLQRAVNAAGVPVRLGIAVTGVANVADGVAVTFADGSTVHYDAVIGADGAGSELRTQLFPGFEGPQYTGQGTWRAVLRRPADVIGTRMYFGHQMVGVNPVSATHMYLFLLQNMPERTWIDPSEWLPRLREQLTEFGGLIARLRDELDEQSQINYRPLDAYVLPAPWYRGNVLLLGDAVHGTTPHAGFGAGLCIEDGMILAELSRTASGNAEWFEAFMARRFVRASTITRATIAIGELEKRHPPATELAAAIRDLQAMIEKEP